MIVNTRVPSGLCGKRPNWSVLVGQGEGPWPLHACLAATLEGREMKRWLLQSKL